MTFINHESDQTSHLCEKECDTLSQRINVLCEIAGNAAELARLSGVSGGVVRKWRDGLSEPTASKVTALAEATGASLVWLLTGEGEMFEEKRDVAFQSAVKDMFQAVPIVESALEEAEVDLDKHWQQMIATWVVSSNWTEREVKDLSAMLSAQSELAKEFALIPGYDIQVAAGSGSLPDSEAPSRRLAFRHKWLKFKGLSPKDLCLVFAKGDSMEPTISDNNTLMIDTSDCDLRDGSIYVIRVNSHLVVKRVQTLLNKDIMLLSDNSAYHPETLRPEQVDDLEVIGKVVWIGKDL
ncbi:MAG: S24 family peptidase [Pontibacterium sp.]